MPAPRPESPQHPRPASSQYEWELENERARRLRVRFLWFAGLISSICFLQIVTGTLNFGVGQRGAGDNVFLLVAVLQGLTSWVAFLWVWRGGVSRQHLYLTAMAVVVAIGLLDLAHVRAQYEFDLIAAAAGTPAPAADVPASGLRVTIDAGDGTPWPMAGSLAVILFSHLLACLFLPWTVREAARPAAVLVGAAVVIMVIDVPLGRVGLAVIPAILVSPLPVLPGLAWCWWRHSRFRKGYLFTFESRQYRSLRQELEGARKLQEACLPRPVESGPMRFDYFYEPMREIGGDMLYVNPPSDAPAAGGRRTLVLLDVTGHGVTAALTVARLVGELERIFAENPVASCVDVITALNRYLYLTLSRHGVFATGVVVSADVSEAGQDLPTTFCYASAGHPPAVIMRHQGGVQELHSSGLMLGVVPPEAYNIDEHEFVFSPGDCLVAYTDGVTEARGPGGQMLGVEGLRGWLKTLARLDPPDWAEDFRRRLVGFRGGPPTDDTLVAWIYRPPVPDAVMHVRPEAVRPPPAYVGR